MTISVLLSGTACAKTNDSRSDVYQGKTESIMSEKLTNYMTEKERNSVKIGGVSLLDQYENWRTSDESDVYYSYFTDISELDSCIAYAQACAEVFEVDFDETQIEKLYEDFNDENSYSWNDGLFACPSLIELPYGSEDFDDKMQQVYDLLDDGFESVHSEECIKNNGIFSKEWQLKMNERIEKFMQLTDQIMEILGDAYNGSSSGLEICFCQNPEFQNYAENSEHDYTLFEGRISDTESKQLDEALDKYAAFGEEIQAEIIKEHGWEDQCTVGPVSITVYRKPVVEKDTDGYYEWEFNYDEVDAIKDNIREISIYDEEMDFNFIVHVTLPPDFDANKTYPMFMFTDGVWRFGNHATLRKMMEDDEIEDVILASIGYDFNIDGMDNSVRADVYYENSEKFLSFITDNLVPYLGEIYKIDFSDSVLYGHSAGGVFTHYAAFHSDLYVNQPFQRYIIGSPAFWGPSIYDMEEQVQGYKSEYGYFDRNETLTKELYITAGDNEDPVYENYYGENDTTLEGVSNLITRLEEKGVTTVIYDEYENGGHWEYIPEMFEKFMIKYYGKNCS